MWKYTRFGLWKWIFNHRFWSTLMCFRPCDLPIYLPTCLQKMILDNNFQNKIIKHGHKFDQSNASLFVSQNDHWNGAYFANKKDHLNHTKKNLQLLQ